MNQPIVLTIIARDQPGIVQRVSEVLRSNGGHWHHSSMSHLAGRFAGILQGEVPKDQVEACFAALQALEAEGVHIVAKLGEESEGGEPSREYRLELVGNDRPGIVADITSVLAAHQVNLHGLETVVEGASMAGGELFRAWATLRLPESMDAQELAAHLEELANDLMVDIDLER